MFARERLALPGQAARTRWTGGGTTKEVIGAIDWGRGESADPGEEKHRPAYIGVEAATLLA